MIKRQQPWQPMLVFKVLTGNLTQEALVCLTASWVKFYRIPNSDPWKHGGTGLGLALTKKLTECLGGQIYVESGSGQTTFVLTFGYVSAVAVNPGWHEIIVAVKPG